MKGEDKSIMREIVGMNIIQDDEIGIFDVTSYVKIGNKLYEFYEENLDGTISYELSLINSKKISHLNFGPVIESYFDNEMFERFYQYLREENKQFVSSTCDEIK